MYLILILISSPFLLYGVLKSDSIFLKTLIILCIFQNFTILLLSRSLTSQDYKICILLKELYVLVFIIIGFIIQPRLKKIDLICIISIGLLLFDMLLNSSVITMQVLASFRQLYIPFLMVILGRRICITEVQLYKIVKFYVVICGICCLFGVFELFGGDAFWEQLNYKFYSLIKLGTASQVNGHFNSIAMYSYDLYPILHTLVKRVASFLVDPVIFGQLLALGILFLYFVKNLIKFQKILLIFMTLVLMFTIAKGGILILLLSGIILLGRLKKKKN